MKAQADLRRFQALPREPRRQGVVEALRAAASAGQAGIRSHLRQRQTAGQVTRVRPLWVVNGLSVTATPEVIQALAARPDVAEIVPDEVPVVPAALPAEANVAAVGAPDLWSLGFQGQGVVIATLDSGVDLSHPDLASRYRGGTNSWFDPYGQHATPYDRTGHGTWTAGVLVGGDAGGTSIGVAPGAMLIAARIWNDAGSATATAIHQAFQWVLDPDGDPATDDAPDVVNNSWSYGAPGCNLAFQPDLQALRSAGIVPVFAAGNFGPGSQTSTSPANYPEALSVGSVNDLGTIAANSSRGPSACGGATFPDGRRAGRVCPDDRSLLQLRRRFRHLHRGATRRGAPGAAHRRIPGRQRGAGGGGHRPDRQGPRRRRSGQRLRQRHRGRCSRPTRRSLPRLHLLRWRRTTPSRPGRRSRRRSPIPASSRTTRIRAAFRSRRSSRPRRPTA